MIIARSVVKVALIFFLFSASRGNAAIQLCLTNNTINNFQSIAQTNGFGVFPSVSWDDEFKHNHTELFCPHDKKIALSDGTSSFAIHIYLNNYGHITFVFDDRNLRYNIQFQGQCAAVLRNVQESEKMLYKQELCKQWYCGNDTGNNKKYAIDIGVSSAWNFGVLRWITYATCLLIPLDGREDVASIVRLD